MKQGLANSNCIVPEFESRVLPGGGVFINPFILLFILFGGRDGHGPD